MYKIYMIFQEPMTSLNPVMSIGKQLIEAIKTHQFIDEGAARARAIQMLDAVHIAEPTRRLGQYPHELSGGMRQRVMIGMALSCQPKVLIADEPTTALDVTIQAQILDVLANVQRERQLAVLLVTHDLGVVAGMAQRVYVMYAGRVVEHAPVVDVFHRSNHPYTRGLLGCLPRLDGRVDLQPIGGAPPGAGRLPTGCAFHPRCPLAERRCRTDVPELRVFESTASACHLAPLAPIGAPVTVEVGP